MPFFCLQPDLADSFGSPRQQLIVMTDKQDPAHKAVMQHIISGVQVNDLLQVRLQR